MLIVFTKLLGFHLFAAWLFFFLSFSHFSFLRAMHESLGVIHLNQVTGNRKVWVIFSAQVHSFCVSSWILVVNTMTSHLSFDAPVLVGENAQQSYMQANPSWMSSCIIVIRSSSQAYVTFFVSPSQRTENSVMLVVLLWVIHARPYKIQFCAKEFITLEAFLHLVKNLNVFYGDLMLLNRI